jgi:hypothetical protein
LEDTAVDAGVILGCNIKKCEGWHGLDWSSWEKVQMVGTCDCYNKYLVLKQQEISWQAEKWVASQEGL